MSIKHYFYFIEASIDYVKTEREINEILDDLKIYNKFERKKFLKIFGSITCDFTIVIEYPYVDKNFRDSFYFYHSRKFMYPIRDCNRILIFKGDINEEMLLNPEDRAIDLNDIFIGYMVVQPIHGGLIGTTVIDPDYLNYCSGYMCLANFSCTVYGNKLTVRGFLYSSQNSETVTCAELSVLGIVNTLSHISCNYSSVLPSDIAKVISENAYERVIPTKGLPYEMVSMLLNRFTGSSRLYFLDSIDIEMGKTENLRRLFHTYVESGLPLAVAVKGDIRVENEPNKKREIRHSVICIGHGNLNCDFYKNKIPMGEDCISVIEPHKCYKNYVFIDDNQHPYVTQEYDAVTMYDNTVIMGFAVVLPSSAFLEANEAYEIAKHTILNVDDVKITEEVIKEKCEYDKEKNPLVFRFFLTSSSEYREYKKETIKSDTLKKLFLEIDMPHYIWVLEISTASLYSNNLAFGEVIIDATSSDSKNGFESVILVHYRDRFGYLDNSFCSYEDLFINYELKEGKRSRWGNFNIYNDIEEDFPLFCNEKKRRVT